MRGYCRINLEAFREKTPDKYGQFEQMTTSHLDITLKRYAAALSALEKADPCPSAEQILNVLTARDEVQVVLTDKAQEPIESLITVIELDRRLKKQAGSITQVDELADWRASLNPAADAWWWFFETPMPPYWWDRLNWLWTVLTVLCLIAALSLVVNISSRWLSDGPDTLGAFAVIGQSVLTALAAGGALTKAGREATEHMLRSLNIPQQFWQKIRFGFAVLLLLGLISLHYSLPGFAVWYNNCGFEHYLSGRLTSAETKYRRALKLNPNYVAPHYNLGLLYEDLQDFAQARTEYRIAVQGGLKEAYNNLARLHIREKEYSAAVTLLEKSLRLPQEDEGKRWMNKMHKEYEKKIVRYDILKNLVWARLGQSRYAEAETRLKEAIELEKDLREEDRRASVHCLWAQVLEGQGNKKKALEEWENCRKYASLHDSDEDAWKSLADERLETEGDKR